MEGLRILKGDIIYSSGPEKLETIRNGFLVTKGKYVIGVYEKLPKEHAQEEVEDYTGKLIIPGLTDLHVHAPQYTFRGLGMNMELIPWLNTYTFPAESKYADVEYAKRVYAKFVDDLKYSATTRAGVFGTIHVESTEYLMDLLEESGVIAGVGKVNMDRNSPDILVETTENSITNTKKWLADIEGKYERVFPILTPRFIPSCTDELMEELGKICRERELPVQSHLSENQSEIAWVQELHPDTSCYGEAYEKYGMCGSVSKTIMAHCVYSDKSEAEMELLRKNQVWVAHCPESNMNLASGVAPVKRMMREGIRVGMGTDVAAGSKLSLFSAMADAVKASKMRWVYVEKDMEPLTIPEVFYLATVGGGSFFGKVGSFKEGYVFDAVIIDDSRLADDSMSLYERLERLVYVPEDSRILAKFVEGRNIL